MVNWYLETCKRFVDRNGVIDWGGYSNEYDTFEQFIMGLRWLGEVVLGTKGVKNDDPKFKSALEMMVNEFYEEEQFRENLELLGVKKEHSEQFDLLAKLMSKENHRYLKTPCTDFSNVNSVRNLFYDGTNEVLPGLLLVICKNSGHVSHTREDIGSHIRENISRVIKSTKEIEGVAFLTEVGKNSFVFYERNGTKYLFPGTGVDIPHEMVTRIQECLVSN